MSFTDIDFAPRRAPSRWTLAGLAAALVLCATGAYRHHEAGRATAEATDQLRKLRSAAHGRPADTGPAPAVSKEAVDSVNQAIAALNVPWPTIMGAIEAVRPPKVALTRLEPRTKDRVVSITAQAEGMDDLIDFMSALASTAPFVEATPVRQEVVADGSAARLQATFEARWEVRP